MGDRAFLDTNILVYAIELDGPSPEKGQAARSLIARIAACISTQVLGEFYSAVTSAKRQSPLAHDEAVTWVQFWKRFDVLPVTVAHVNLALELKGSFRIHYYDALILATARLTNCNLVYSEDLNTEQDYGGVRVQNPFKSLT
jgi:predicted nucleic acid-binding protein